jgi:PilZ domain
MLVFHESRSFCRRRSSRFEAPDYVYAYWRCDGIDDVSRVRDLSVGGLFLQTEKPQKHQEGVTIKIDFLVPEGQIRAEAEVRRSEPHNGIGLKFTAITHEDRHRLAALLARLRSYRTELRKNMLQRHALPSRGF